MNRVVVPDRQATQSGGIGSLELILGLLKFKKSGSAHYRIARYSIPTDINSDDVPCSQNTSQFTDDNFTYPWWNSATADHRRNPPVGSTDPLEVF